MKYTVVLFLLLCSFTRSSQAQNAPDSGSLAAERIRQVETFLQSEDTILILGTDTIYKRDSAAIKQVLLLGAKIFETRQTFDKILFSFDSASKEIDVKNKELLYKSHAQSVREAAAELTRFINDELRNMKMNTVAAHASNFVVYVVKLSESSNKKGVSAQQAIELYNYIDTSRVRMLSIIDNQFSRDSIEAASAFKTGNTENSSAWTEIHFNNVPVAEQKVFLDKLKNDCRELEKAILVYLNKEY